MLAAEALLVRRVRTKFRERRVHRIGSFERICTHLIIEDFVKALRLIRKNRT